VRKLFDDIVSRETKYEQILWHFGLATENSVMSDGAIWRISGITALMLTTIAAALAQVPQNWTRCEDLGDTLSLDVAISGCTSVIESGSENQVRLAYAFQLRATMYGLQGKRDLAIADFNQSIQLNPCVYRKLDSARREVETR
jgi:hypothetical protein